MLKASNAYKDMMNKPMRNRGYISISLGVINQNAQVDGVVTTVVADWSKGSMFDTTETNYKTYATCEKDFITCNDTMLIMPEDRSICKVNGTCTTDLLGAIRIDFGSIYDLKGLTIEFDPFAFPKEMKIYGSNFETTYSDLSSPTFVTEDTIGETNYLIIQPTKMQDNNTDQRLRIRNITMGVGFVFTNPVIESFSIEDFVDSISSEISYKTVSMSIFDKEGKFNVDNDSSFMAYLEPMQPMHIAIGVDLDDGTKEWKQIGSCYIRDWNSKNDKINFVATDRLSQLKNNYSHNVLETRTVGSEIEAILQDCGLTPNEYEIDDYLYAVNVTAPIEEKPHRECLQIIANAYRCIIREDENGILKVSANFSTVIDPEDLELSTNSETEWSNLRNILGEVTTTYADLTTNMISANDTTKILPDDSSDYLDTTGWVSGEIADANGNFETNPYIEIVLPAKYTYYALTVKWGEVLPKSCIITTYDNDTLIETFNHQINSRISVFANDFTAFNKLRITVNKTEPYARVLIDSLKFGDSTDYVLTKDLMYDDPRGFRDDRVKEVRVKIYTYRLNSDNEPELVDDEVYYTKTLAATGHVKTCKNPLITTQEHAELIAEWLGNYFNNNVSYSVTFRGDPRIQASDIIRMESDFKNNLQVEVENTKLSFNGAFKGDLELRRALKTL